ncbi:MAG: tetratricopeptide repeat protein [Candidatus Ozemobacteraceae bacterium]
MFNRIATMVIALMLGSTLFLLPLVFADAGGNRWQDYPTAFGDAEKAFAQQKFHAAVVGYQAALAIKANEVRPRFRLGQSLLSLGDYAEASLHFQKLLQDYPNNITARLLFTKCLVGLNQIPEARGHLGWILKVQPEHQEARKMLDSLMKNTPTGVSGASSMTASRNSSADASFSANGERYALSAGPANPATDEIPAPASVAEAEAALPGSSGTTSPSMENIQEGMLISSGVGGAKVPSGFAPLKSGNTPGKTQGKAVDPREKKALAERPIPPAAEPAKSFKVADFIGVNIDSFTVKMEYAKFCLERDELKKAGKAIDEAEGVAVEAKDTRRFLEVQIFKSLHALYEADIREFGQQLLRIKPLLSKETYASFLDIYNKAQNASSSIDVARLVGGVAMGADHYAVAARILKEVVVNAPNDELGLAMLGQAQLQIRDFAGAEKSFLLAVKRFPQNPEYYFNLARFYLTARFVPTSARQYALMAAGLNPSDPRIPVVMALLDYAEGKVQTGVDRLRKALAATSDPELARIIKRVLAEGGALRDGEISAARFASLLALPGSGGPDGLIRLGEEYLRRGSFLLALKCFMEAKDLAEVGRGYLALATHLFTAGEEKAAARAAGFGLNALNSELKRLPNASKAHLYMALYYFERGDSASAKRHVQSGMVGQPTLETRKHLSTLAGRLG